MAYVRCITLSCFNPPNPDFFHQQPLPRDMHSDFWDQVLFLVESSRLPDKSSQVMIHQAGIHETTLWMSKGPGNKDSTQIFSATRCQFQFGFPVELMFVQRWNQPEAQLLLTQRFATTTTTTTTTITNQKKSASAFTFESMPPYDTY